MNIRRFRALHAAGASYAEIARECGCDWRTVRKYLAEDAASVPPSGSPRAGTQPRKLARLESLVDEMERGDLTLEEAMRKHAEGSALSKYCLQQLQLAETAVNKVIRESNGTLSEMDLILPEAD